MIDATLSADNQWKILRNNKAPNRITNDTLKSSLKIDTANNVLTRLYHDRSHTSSTSFLRSWPKYNSCNSRPATNAMTSKKFRRTKRHPFDRPRNTTAA